jgi:Fe-S-cluster-containing dehydrogenase component
MARVFTVDYQWCTGCHSCELACQMENDLSAGQFGIKIAQIGPWEYGEKEWQYTYMPILTDQCNLCGGRIAKGKLPSCVQHCQAKCIKFIEDEEAARALSDNKRLMTMTV